MAVSNFFLNAQPAEVPQSRIVFPPNQITPTGTCDPTVSGSVSMCTIVNLTETYTITNFSNNVSDYTIALFPENFNLINNPVAIDPVTGEFTIQFLDNYHHYYIVVQFFDGQCAGEAWIEVTPCCSNFNDFLTDGNPSSSQLGAIFISNEWYLANATVLLAGTFTVNANMHFYNCEILMAPGAEIKINGGYYLNLDYATQVQAACDIMWKGITLENDAKLTAKGVLINPILAYYTRIRDAQFAVKIKEDAEYEFDGYVAFERNYVGIYFPPLQGSAMHTISPYNNNLEQWYYIAGTHEHYGGNWNWYSELLPAFTGQSPVPNSSQSRAGILMEDVANFSFFNSSFSSSSWFQTAIGWNKYGIYSRNSNLSLMHFNFVSCLPVPTTSPSASDGTGIFAVADPSNPSVSNSFFLDGFKVSAPIPLGYFFSSMFNFCKTGIFVSKGMNVEINNIAFNYCEYPNSPSMCNQPNFLYDNCKTHILASLPDRTFRVTNCAFQYAFKHIKATDMYRSVIDIQNNYFASPLDISPAVNFSNTCIQIHGNVGKPISSDINISDNVYDQMRIGLYMNNMDGNPCAINNNYYKIHEGIYNPNLNWTLYNQKHFGCWLDHCNDLRFSDNVFENVDGLPSEDSSYKSLAIAYNIKSSGSIVSQGSINIKQSAINYMGTAFRFVDKCSSVYLQCNEMDDCMRGVFLNYADISSQGISGMPSWGNEWQNWNANYRAEGNVLSGGSIQIDWYYDPNVANQNPSPHFVSPPGSFLGTITMGTSNCITPIDADPELADHIFKIIYEQIYYYLHAEETEYRDREFAFLTLKYDSVLRSSDASFESYYHDLIGSNFDLLDSVGLQIRNESFGEALEILSRIEAENGLEENLQFALGIAINLMLDTAYEISGEDMEALLALSDQTVWEAGRAVFIARALTDSEINDEETGMRLIQPAKASRLSYLSVYPNPSKNMIYFDGVNDNDILIKIIDLTGRTLRSEAMQTNELDVSELAPGVYLVKLFRGDQLMKAGKFSKF